jgi:hypothetical protein
MRKPCRKSKMLTLADTNSGRRQRLFVGTELSTRKQVPALCIGEKVRPFSEMGHLSC